MGHLLAHDCEKMLESSYVASDVK